MKRLDSDDLETIKSLKCFQSQLFYGYPGLGPETINLSIQHPYFYGYRLCDVVWEKPYKKSDFFFKRWFLSFWPDKRVQFPTKYLFVVYNFERYFWADYIDRDRKVTFEEVFENSSDEIREQLVYHLDIFS